MQIKIALNKDLFGLIVVYMFFGISTAKGDLNDNEISPLIENQISASSKDILKSLLKLNFDFDTLHSRLHLQSDLINSISTKVLYTDTTSAQCETIQFFNEIEFRLHRIKQNLINLMNNNNDKHLDKIDSILFKMTTLRDCSTANNSQQLEKIKTQLSNTETKITELSNRLEILNTNIESILNPHPNIETLNNLVNQVHIKMNKQENILQKLNEQISDLPNTSARSHCHGNCLIHRLLEADKKMSSEKLKQTKN